MYEPISRFDPVLVNHNVNVWGATRVITRIDGGQLDHAVRVSVPTTAEPGLVAVEMTGIEPIISGVRTSCVG